MARVSTSKRYEVSGQGMLQRIGDPGKIYEWHPAVDATEMLDGGRKRVDKLGDGGRVSATILEQAENGDSEPIRLESRALSLARRASALAWTPPAAPCS